MQNLRAGLNTLMSRFGKRAERISFEERVLRDWRLVLTATFMLLLLGVGAGAYAYWYAVHIEREDLMSVDDGAPGRTLVDPEELSRIVKAYEERSQTFTTLRGATVAAPQPAALTPEAASAGSVNDDGVDLPPVREASSSEQLPPSATPTPSM